MNDNNMPLKVNGLAKVYDYLHNHPDYYNAIKTYIENDINGADVEESELVDSDEDVVDADE